MQPGGGHSGESGHPEQVQKLLVRPLFVTVVFKSQLGNKGRKEELG